MAYRIDRLELYHFGPIDHFSCSDFGGINLIIGGNGTGKTFLMKAMYAALRTMEVFKRGNEGRSFADLLSERLRWTFQVERIGNLVSNLNPQGLGTVFDVPAPYDAAQSYALLRVHLRHGQHSSLG